MLILKQPNWFIRNRMIPLSARRPKVEKKVFGRLCIDCLCDLDKELASAHFVSNINGRDRYRCHLCWQKDLTGSRILPALYGGTSNVEEVSKGNLENWMYRYFVGSRLPTSNLAICRCCREAVLDDPARRKHPARNRCWKILEKCYEALDNQALCIVCSKWTLKKEWGVQLCQSSCKEKFMFDNHRWPQLERTLALYRGIKKVDPVL